MDTPDPAPISERARYVTDLVSMWIVNDGEHFHEARRAAGSDWAARSGYSELREYAERIIRTARRTTAPWHVAQELAPNDYARIHWADVANQLTGE